MVIIDVLGKACPIPVIEAKKALAESEAVSVLVDNLTAVQNLEKMAKGYGYDFSYSENAPNRFKVEIDRNGHDAPPAKTAHAASADESEDALQCGDGHGLVVAFGRDAMGENTVDNSHELGKILIKGFISSLTQLDPPPTALLFFNSGAFLTREGSNTIDDIKKLEDSGTRVLTCGTCANYYELTEKIAVGSIGNMLEIAETMAKASKVINI